MRKREERKAINRGNKETEYVKINKYMVLIKSRVTH